MCIRDRDGTLLPMDQEAFTTGYFKFLAKKLAPYGYEPKSLVDAIWAGTAADVYKRQRFLHLKSNWYQTEPKGTLFVGYSDASEDTWTDTPATSKNTCLLYTSEDIMLTERLF